MKISLAKDNIRTIFKNIKRYFVIILIVFLGSCIFSSFNSFIPDIKESLQQYYDKYNLMDLNIASTNGITTDEIDLIKEVDGISEVMGSVTSDIELKYQNNSYTLTMHSLSDEALFSQEENYINRLDLIEGTMPKKKNEIVISKEMSEELEISIGQVIELYENDKSVFEDMLNYNEYVVAGITDSPLYTYIRQNQVAGQNYAYIYMPLQSINYPAYTECYATVEEDVLCFEDEYKDIIEEYKEKVKQKLEDNIDHTYYTNMQKMGINISEPTYYTTGRNENFSFQIISQDINIVKGLSGILPIIFFLVASLVSLTSTSRLVDETRSQIGIYKALGYNDKQVLKKYLLYAISASIIGSVIGVYIGSEYLTQVIFFVYETTHKIKIQSIEIQIFISFLSIALSIFCVTIASVSSCKKAVAEYIYKLMRPKTPPNGKKILLEKINIFWSKLNFMQKVTTRNLFRYKKRLIMTIIGISGCTSILIAGFSLMNAAKSVANIQYNDVFKYDIEIELKEGNYSNNDYEKLDRFFNNIDGIEKTILYSSENTMATSEKSDNEENVKIMIFDENQNIEDFINLNSPNRKEKYQIPNKGIIMTEKLASLLNVVKGDKFKLDKTKDNEIEIINITENYYNNYIYISKEYYEELINENVKENSVFINVEEGKENNIDEIADKCKENDMVYQISKVSKILLTFAKSMESLNSIMILLVLFAGALAFTVLYNLSILNISERLRELATLKVLGFREKEVLNYVSRENNLLTVLGVIFGVLLGYVLTLYVLKECETSIYMFNKDIYLMAYIISIVLTFLFSTIVNKLSQFALKRIDMIDSLKSVE